MALRADIRHLPPSAVCSKPYVSAAAEQDSCNTNYYAIKVSIMETWYTRRKYKRDCQNIVYCHLKSVSWLRLEVQVLISHGLRIAQKKINYTFNCSIYTYSTPFPDRIGDRIGEVDTVRVVELLLRRLVPVTPETWHLLDARQRSAKPLVTGRIRIMSVSTYRRSSTEFQESVSHAVFPVSGISFGSSW